LKSGVVKKALIAYSATLLAFLVLDDLWLGVLMAPTYRALLGSLMLDQPLLAPARQSFSISFMSLVAWCSWCCRRTADSEPPVWARYWD
jgi:uncharacterized membrane protein